eukprot:sb/3470108/
MFNNLLASSIPRYLTRRMSSLARLGLPESKVAETQKNTQLTGVLEGFLASADKRGVVVDGVTGKLMYGLGTKLKKQDNMGQILDLILEKKVTSDTQLTAALEFVKANPVNPDQSRLEEACGVGVVITPDQIKTAVSAKVEANLSQIKTQRYRLPATRYNTGPIMGQIKKELKWADGSQIKAEIDSTIAGILGAKTEADNKPVEKVRGYETSI